MLRWCLEDVATAFEPFIGREDAHDCTEQGPDGYLDLTLNYKAQELVAALSEVQDGDLVVLQLTGNLMEDFAGTPIAGEHVLWILKNQEREGHRLSDGPRRTDSHLTGGRYCRVPLCCSLGVLQSPWGSAANAIRVGPRMTYTYLRSGALSFARLRIDKHAQI